MSEKFEKYEGLKKLQYFEVKSQFFKITRNSFWISSKKYARSTFLNSYELYVILIFGKKLLWLTTIDLIVRTRIAIIVWCWKVSYHCKQDTKFHLCKLVDLISIKIFIKYNILYDISVLHMKHDIQADIHSKITPT